MPRDETPPAKLASTDLVAAIEAKCIGRDEWQVMNAEKTHMVAWFTRDDYTRPAHAAATWLVENSKYQDQGYQVVERRLFSELEELALECAKRLTQDRGTLPDTSEVVSDELLAKAFANTNFGGADHRHLLHVGVLKKACGYHCGHTITTIMKELRLIGKEGVPTKRGRRMMQIAFRQQMIEGP